MYYPLSTSYLEKEEKIELPEEIAKLISGKDISNESIEHAKKLKISCE